MKTNKLTMKTNKLTISVTGGAGSGKSRLSHYLAEQLASDGFDVLFSDEDEVSSETLAVNRQEILDRLKLDSVVFVENRQTRRQLKVPSLAVGGIIPHLMDYSSQASLVRKAKLELLKELREFYCIGKMPQALIDAVRTGIFEADINGRIKDLESS